MWPSVFIQKSQVVQDLGQQFFFHNIRQQEIGQFDNRKSYCFLHPGMKGKMKICLRNIKEYRLLLHLYKIHRFSTKKFKDIYSKYLFFLTATKSLLNSLLPNQCIQIPADLLSKPKIESNSLSNEHFLSVDKISQVMIRKLQSQLDQ